MPADAQPPAAAQSATVSPATVSPAAVPPAVRFDPAAFGVLTRVAALAEGLDDRSLAGQVRTGALLRHRRGVYLRAPLPSNPVDRWLQRAAAELAAAGPGACIGHEAAALLWDLDGFDGFAFTAGAEAPSPITVLVPSDSARRGVGRRCVGFLEPPSVRCGLAVTSAAQTLLDLGHGLSSQRRRLAGGLPGALLDPVDRVELAVESALRRGLVDEAGVRALLARTPAQRGGRAVLAAVFDRRPAGAAPTGSHLETRGLQVLRAGGIPDGVRQASIVESGVVIACVDCLIGGRVIVEFDGRDVHDRTRDDVARDRRRWTRLSALGYLVAVFTPDDVEARPATVVEQVGRLLALAAAR